MIGPILSCPDIIPPLCIKLPVLLLCTMCCLYRQAHSCLSNVVLLQQVRKLDCRVSQPPKGGYVQLDIFVSTDHVILTMNVLKTAESERLHRENLQIYIDILSSRTEG